MATAGRRVSVVRIVLTRSPVLIFMIYDIPVTTWLGP
jgi:hypothetical protein